MNESHTRTSAIIRHIASEIESILRENDLAVPNPVALAQLELQHSRMRLHCGYCAERIRKISTLAKDFYSARRHQFHPQGADGVLRDIRTNLQAVRSWSSVWEKHGK
ncbi:MULTISPECIES: hypothetical protein [Burkholderia cepacia complex]|nr:MULTISPECIES: hypothetical protein [Burkholderia cepacia complex]MCA7968211.1 hypothetical protein [Burkholderia cenocepacia]MCA8089137.1 hypothetical protein [Burkholderia cenocepacia]